MNTYEIRKRIENGAGRYSVVRNALDYSVVDKQAATEQIASRPHVTHNIIYRGGHDRAWATAIRYEQAHMKAQANRECRAS